MIDLTGMTPEQKKRTLKVAREEYKVTKEEEIQGLTTDNKEKDKRITNLRQSLKIEQKHNAHIQEVLEDCVKLNVKTKIQNYRLLATLNIKEIEYD